MQDEANMKAEMAAQLAKLTGSEATVNGTASEVEEKIATQNSDRIKRNTQLASSLSGVVDSADATLNGVASANTATTEALVAAGNVADAAFNELQSEMQHDSETFAEVLETQKKRQAEQIASAELEASRKSSSISADASSAAQLWEGSVQNGLTQVSQNTQALAVLFSNLAAINSTVIEDIQSMIDTIDTAYGKAISKATASSDHALYSFARVEDVIGVFGKIVEQYVDESTADMETAKSDASLIGSLVSRRLDELDDRVDDQIRWLDGGNDKTIDAQTSGLHAVMALQESEKVAVADVDSSLKEMEGDITAAVNQVEATLTDAQMDSTNWMSGVLKSVGDWQARARSKFANKLIASKASSLEEK
jgi:hypothetical protein